MTGSVSLTRLILDWSSENRFSNEFCTLNYCAIFILFLLKRIVEIIKMICFQLNDWLHINILDVWLFIVCLSQGDQVHKSVFIIFFQGDQLKNRVKKICEGCVWMFLHIVNNKFNRGEENSRETRAIVCWLSVLCSVWLGSVRRCTRVQRRHRRGRRCWLGSTVVLMTFKWYAWQTHDPSQKLQN